MWETVSWSKPRNPRSSARQTSLVVNSSDLSSRAAASFPKTPRCARKVSVFPKWFTAARVARGRCISSRIRNMFSGKKYTVPKRSEWAREARSFTKNLSANSSTASTISLPLHARAFVPAEKPLAKCTETNRKCAICIIKCTRMSGTWCHRAISTPVGKVSNRAA